MKKILNLTQHPATPEQVAAGVVDLVGDELAQLKVLLTFDVLPTREEVWKRSAAIANVTRRHHDVSLAMIGGAPFLMSNLERDLLHAAVESLYAFSRREVVEEVMPDGSVRKTAVFRHAGFVKAF